MFSASKKFPVGTVAYGPPRQRSTHHVSLPDRALELIPHPHFNFPGVLGTGGQAEVGRREHARRPARIEVVEGVAQVGEHVDVLRTVSKEECLGDIEIYAVEIRSPLAVPGDPGGRSVTRPSRLLSRPVKIEYPCPLRAVRRPSMKTPSGSSALSVVSN